MSFLFWNDFKLPQDYKERMKGSPTAATQGLPLLLFFVHLECLSQGRERGAWLWFIELQI